MLNTNVDMRVEAASLIAESRQLRVEGKRALKYARRLKNTQQDASRTNVAYYRYNAVYQERMSVRREARLLHLARMLLKGQSYHRVEPLTYEQVDPQELFEVLWQWDPSVDEELVHAWLDRDVA